MCPGMVNTPGCSYGEGKATAVEKVSITEVCSHVAMSDSSGQKYCKCLALKTKYRKANSQLLWQRLGETLRNELIGRLARPEEIANLCVFLASDEVSPPLARMLPGIGKATHYLDGGDQKDEKSTITTLQANIIKLLRIRSRYIQ